MLRKIFIIYLLAFALANILTGCCNCPQNYKQRIRFMNIQQLKNTNYTIDSASIKSTIDSSNNYSGKNYGLRIKLDYERIAMRTKQNMSFVNTAYACKCAESEFVPEYPVTDIRVTTLNAYDATHPAMSDVSDYFKSAAYMNGRPVLGPIADLFTATYMYPGVEFNIFLIQKPTTGTQHQFLVTVKLQNGTELNGQTSLLQL